MTKCYSVEFFTDSRPILYFPKDNDFDQPIEQVAFGSLVTSAKVLPHERKKKTISISTALKDFLHIPNIPLRLHLFCHHQTFFLGPIVGIFTAGFTRGSKLPLGNRSYQFAKFFSVGHRVGVLPILFGLQHIDWDKGLVRGYYFYQNRWMEMSVPLPNIIYDRLPNREVEKLKKIKEAKGKLTQEYVIPSFNPGFFNKIEIYKKLTQNTKTKTYIPKTIPFQKEKDVKMMLDEFQCVYMKPNEGSLGNGVYRIEKEGKDLLCSFRDKKGNNRIVKFSSIKRLLHLLEKKDKGEYVIQRGIPLLKINGCPADFRVHTNKGKDGKWYVTAIAVKVANPLGATTHRLSGGSVKTVDELFPDQREKNRNVFSLINAALILSKELDKRYHERLGEIGFDLGIDEEGNVWMFEANSKPGRSIFSHPDLSKNEQMIRKFLLSYSVYLTEQFFLVPEKFFEKAIQHASFTANSP
ncbi:YheC/YheD family protein [Fervidibacillus halotolerans]|uniref:YheC/YheD family protein n=1 Tax=Fervidibacillus halotolerans TaxID=2980027 RepID=A0A9E8M0M9_9BACI|nr:YheC/YheD family protein [Fervidibacillus halotolerans]WAA12996.1 YheC/YheD family protein [Fervidibacillus halotolerans]